MQTECKLFSELQDIYVSVHVQNVFKHHEFQKSEKEKKLKNANQTSV